MDRTVGVHNIEDITINGLNDSTVLATITAVTDEEAVT